MKDALFTYMWFRKHLGNLEFKSVNEYEPRHQFTEKLIRLSDEKYHFDDFDWVIADTEDWPSVKTHEGHKVFCAVSDGKDYSDTSPDFLFWAWPDTMINDYEETTKEIALAGDATPSTNLMGWRGSVTHDIRKALIAFDDKIDFDFERITTFDSNSNALSWPAAVRKWRYLIDVEGNGYSTRVKLMMFSKRVVFLQDRQYKEWYWENMIPWEHYVPVANDLHDLREKLSIIKANPELEHKIANAAFEFARHNLTRECAIDRWAKLIMKKTKKYAVVARYNENMRWVYDAKKIDKAFIYNKGEDDLKETEKVGIWKVPNVGREADTYLRFICDHYNTLDPEAIYIFTQGDPFDISLTFLLKVLRLKFTDNFPINLSMGKAEECFYPAFISETTHPRGLPVFHYFTHLFFDDQVRPDTIHMVGYGGLWATTGKDILFRKKEFYIECMRILHKSANPLEAYVFERLWQYIFDPKYLDWFSHSELIRKNWALGQYNNQEIT